MRCRRPTDLPASRPTPRPTSSALLSDSAACEGVQPAAELRHVPRHGHALHAQGALCSRVLRPQTPVEPSLARYMRGHRPADHPPRLPGRPPQPRIVWPPFDSAGSEGIQPTAKLRHVPRHRNGRNAQGAPRLYPAPGFQSSLSLHAACAATAPSATSRIVCLLSTRQQAEEFNQPLSFDTSKVTTMEEMFEVHSTRALPTNSSRASLARCMRGCRPSATSSHRMPPFRLGSSRRRSTSR